MVNRVFNALLEIQKIYLKYPTIGNKHKYGERVFAYEFYHQLRKQFQGIYLDITGEPIKGEGILPDMDETIIPDFVIHNYATNDHNEIAIEIKVTPKLTAKQIKKDLKKLDKMITGPLHYNYGIFIAANCDFKKLVFSSRKYKDKILAYLAANPNLLVWNILPLNEGIDMRDCINPKDVINYTIDNI